jgi:hypothetical protein
VHDRKFAASAKLGNKEHDPDVVFKIVDMARSLPIRVSFAIVVLYCPEEASGRTSEGEKE